MFDFLVQVSYNGAESIISEHKEGFLVDKLQKLALLGESAKYDVCASSSATPKKFADAAIGRTVPSGICHSFTPDGRCVSLFKVLMSNQCEKDCLYCPNRSGRDVPRTRFAPEELAGLFMEFYRRNYVEGLFLSSGVMHSTGQTMQQLLETLEILRFRYKFGGYIHLKILPGTGEAETERAVELANRVSLNMEAPSALHLARLSTSKNFATEIMGGMSRIHRHLRNQAGVSHSTQFIVGAAQESDRDILDSTVRLYSDYGLKRAYFSAFQPVPGTPLGEIAGAPLVREHRLYQADFLFRYYGFRMEELTYDPGGNLDLATDPKQAYAAQHPERFPLEINRATISELLRIPGIGPRSAKKIILLRRECSFRSVEDLKRIGVVTKRALPFILVQGKKFTPALSKAARNDVRHFQPSLWGDPI